MEISQLKTLQLLYFVVTHIYDISTQTINFTLAQAHLCSYVSLCTLSNTSSYESNKHFVPCCRDCSCEKQCEVSGTCCPDYNSEGNWKMSPQNWNESVSNWSERFNHLDNGLGCVRTHYGFLHSNEGYVMVDSCPDTFSDHTTKARCEAKWDYLNVDVYDHLPILDKTTGKNFKNRFCMSCHSPTNGSYELWDFRFVCNRKPVLDIFNLTSPFAIMEKMFRSTSKACSIVFRPKNISIEDVSTETCLREEIIDTCEDGYVDPGVVTACNGYTWPVMSQNGMKLETYKNYACMVCNRIEFKDFCYLYASLDYRTEPHFAVAFNVEMPDLKSSETWDRYQNKTHAQDVIIRRNFTNANMHCSEGFIYDERKSLCRQVLCPVYFVVNNGKCEPMFSVIENVFYNVILEILLPSSIKGAQVSVVDAALFSSLDDIFRKRLGKDNYDLSLWRNNISTKEINSDVKYAVLLIVKWQFAEGSYLALLRIVNRLALVERQLPISISIKTIEINVNVGLTLGTFVSLYTYSFRYRLVYLQTVDPMELEQLHTVRPLGWRPSLRKINHAMDITKASFCHTVVMHKDEVRRLTPYGRFMESLPTKRILNYFYIQNVHIICIHDAFRDVEDRSRYVMNSTASLRYLYKWQQKPKVRLQSGFTENTSGIHVSGNIVGRTTDTKSFVAVLCSCGLVLALVFIKCGLKRYGTCTQTNDDAEPDTSGDGFVENIQMVYIRTRPDSIDEN